MALQNHFADLFLIRIALRVRAKCVRSFSKYPSYYFSFSTQADYVLVKRI
jgi:hypothetical protein